MTKSPVKLKMRPSVGMPDPRAVLPLIVDAMKRQVEQTRIDEPSVIVADATGRQTQRARQ